MGRQHGGPRPLRRAEPHFSGDATLHRLQAGAQAGGRVRRTAREQGPRRGRHCALRSRAAARRLLPEPRTRQPQAPSPPRGPPRRPLLTQRVQGEGHSRQAEPFEEPECAEHGHVHRQRHSQSEDEDEDDGEEQHRPPAKPASGRGHS